MLMADLELELVYICSCALFIIVSEMKPGFFPLFLLVVFGYLSRDIFVHCSYPTINRTSSRNYSHSLTRRNFNPYHISECGVQVVKCGAQCNDNSRIVGGRETYRGQFPWMVNM